MRMRPSSFGTWQAWVAERFSYWGPSDRVIEQSKKAAEAFPKTDARCLECDTVLSRYNTTRRCWLHHHQRLYAPKEKR